MKKADKKFGPVPVGQEYGPTLEYVQVRGYGSSCGQSGDRYASFAFDNNSTSKFEKRKAFMKESSETKYSDKGCDYRNEK